MSKSVHAKSRTHSKGVYNVFGYNSSDARFLHFLLIDFKNPVVVIFLSAVIHQCEDLADYARICFSC